MINLNNRVVEEFKKAARDGGVVKS
jgi:hypothetical protein